MLTVVTVPTGFGLAALLIAGLTMSASGQDPQSFDLEEYRWKNRVLLVFASGAEDAGYRHLGGQVDRLRRDFVERDMLLVAVFHQNVSLSDSIAADAVTAKELRRRFDITDSSFRIVLIGKDGGVKLQSGDPDVLPEVFALIDTMPMRRREMRHRAKTE